MASCILCVLLLMTSISRAEEPPKVDAPSPIPTASVSPIKCIASEATPLLRKSMYSGSSNYLLTTTSENPMALLESVNIDKNVSLKIEQRGCEDIRVNIKVDMKKAAKNNYSLIRRATKILNDLHVDPKALLSTEQINQIATQINAESSKSKSQTALTVCISKKATLCVAEVKLTADSNSVEFAYVAQP